MSTKTIGNIGESAASTFLERKGFTLVERNYRKKWGELDIIATKESVLHFFEVKSVTFIGADRGKGHRPEDNVHGLKVRSIRRMIETYMDEFKISSDMPSQFHILCVFMNMEKRTARVKWLENVIL